MWRHLSLVLFGRPVEGQLPARVRRDITEQQVQAEVLIGYIQLALVLFFIVLYAAAPKTSEGTPFSPVPYVLGLYFVFTVIRLVLAHYRILPRWFLLLSVVGDIGLLMVLIWSFHLQYQQPAPFYLKAPTLLYVFIFIALRTLRFEPIFVITAGLTAAVGWVGMLIYAIQDMPGGMEVVTRDYVLYMTSNRVLIGAEVDKIISIGLVSAVLAVALVRARRLLERSVAAATVARDLSRFVSPEIAAEITTADRPIQPGDAHVKEASMLFCDIEGFSGIAERLSADALMAMLNDYFAAVSAVIDRHGGVITQFQGDAMLITFNTVRADPDHAANAVRTAVGIQEALEGRRFGPDRALRTRCGINTGTMVIGAVGTAERMLFTVHGDEVNIAARLEQMNKQFGTYVLVSERTARTGGGEFTFQPLGEVATRGRSARVAVYTVAQAAGPKPAVAAR
ncbi:MAG: adenylate/guanylate cyclase domain-containing protein [Rhodospirillales bacterium]|nr:MAG: adenylate/guanylate cyclase domain-containing protein [Rhodospirillales bacterium]